jgi:CheY-like chemotaxis protein
MEPESKNKTILVVDDDPAMLTPMSDWLANIGYNVRRAATGPKGLQVSREFKGEIHLLLSDFQMPGMSGSDLAIAMTIDRPKLKVLLMSGFNYGKLILNEGWHFLDRPFLPSQLRALIVGLVDPDKKA